MSQSLFITLLAVLTTIAGAALVVLLLRRRRATRTAAERAKRDAARRAHAADSAVAARRTIDDYAIPVGFDSRPSADDEIDIGKICPACGARYGSHHRVCQRCGDSELAALN